MQDRSRIPGEPIEDGPKARRKGTTISVVPELSSIDHKDPTTQLEHTGSEGPTQPDTSEPITKNAAAVALGRLGGKKGGKVRAARMTADERSEAARRAAIARWTHRDAK